MVDQRDRMQTQRWELKYVVPSDVALASRDFLSGLLELDPYGVDSPDFSYPVHNLYLDSSDLGCFRATLNGDDNRFKLRLRYYQDSPDSPVFLEIKRRHKDSILKQRVGIRRSAADGVLHGRYPTADEMIHDDPANQRAVENFIRLVEEQNAKPTAHVFYRREAWINRFDDSVRVTLDRDSSIAPEFDARLTEAMDGPERVFEDQVVLELKFAERYPDWFGSFVSEFQLEECSASKYADGIAEAGESRFSRNDFTPSGVQPGVPDAIKAIRSSRREKQFKSTLVA